jgi:hypothetical protein
MKGTPIMQQAMKARATETAKSLTITNLKTEQGWCETFIKHEGLSLRHQVTTHQKVPANFQEILLTFQQYVIQLQKKRNYPFKHGGNAYERVVPHNDTDVGCAKEVKIRRACNEKYL